MPQFEIRCNTAWILAVEAEDEESARKIAEDTDLAEWDRADSPYEVERAGDEAELGGTSSLANSVRQPGHHAAERPYWLRLDMPLFQRQRELLTAITDLARKAESYLPASDDAELLNGLLELTDAIADQHGQR